MSETLWRGYDRAALDEQINLRARTPEHVDFFARWAEESAEVRQRLPGRLDLAYGETAAERLDYLPAGHKAPLVVFIHGGYWQSLDKSDFTFMAPPFLEAGIAFASLNYTLAPAARIPQMVAEVRRAVGWLHANAGELGFDPARLVVAGHSAGGHLAAMAMVTDWRAEGLAGDALAGGCAISGIYQLEPIAKSYQQDVLQIDAEAVRSSSPHGLIAAGAPPLLLAVGSEEPREFLDQQAEFAAAWRAAGLSVSEVPLPGRHHFNAVEAMAEPGHPLFEAVCALARP